MMFYWLKHPEHDGWFWDSRRLRPTRHMWGSMCIVFAVMCSAQFLHSLYSCPNHEHQEFHLGSLLIHILFISYITWFEISFKESDFLLPLEIVSIIYCYMNFPTRPYSFLFPFLAIIPVTQFTFIVGTKIYLLFRSLLYFICDPRPVGFEFTLRPVCVHMFLVISHMTVSPVWGSAMIYPIMRVENDS
jgi:hypothetical protein